MHYRETFEYIDNQNPELFLPPSPHHHPAFDELLADRENSNQGGQPKPMSSEDVLAHPIGLALRMVHTYPKCVTTGIMAYNGITEVSSREDPLLAVIGGLYVHGSIRGHGFGTAIVENLIKVASSSYMREMLGQEGYVAYCNDASGPLFEKLGFVIDGVNDDGKQIATWRFQP